MKTVIKAVVAVLALALFAAACFGGSLYRKGQEIQAQKVCVAPPAATIYTTSPAEKTNAPKLHDLVKVLVREISSASTDGKTTINKDTQFDASLKKYISWDGKPLNDNGGLPAISLEGKLKTDNNAGTSKTMRMAAIIKAEVVEVLPNGNLVIEAVKERTVNQENETMTLTGVIDPDDLDATGTIVSDDIAQLKVVYKGKGSVSDAQKRGILGRILDWIWPF